MTLLLLLLACQPKIEPGTSAYGDGNSVDCGDLVLDERIDITASCVDGLCADDASYGDLTDAYGEPDACEEREYEDIDGPDLLVAACVWEQGEGDGLEAVFFEGLKDLTDESTTSYFVLDEFWSGTDANGLGTNLPMRCFEEVFGPPDDTYTFDGETWPWHATWLSVGSFALFDSRDNGTTQYEQDGLVDGLALY